MATAGRPGFSLLELTIGLLLLDVGVLAVAATAAGVVRMTAAGGREGGAALVAAARLEALRASSCGPAGDAPAGAEGTARTGPFVERWSVAPDGWVARADVTVSWADGRGPRAAGFETLIACSP
jgi:Tfp pilus assembly protein PilV